MEDYLMIGFDHHPPDNTTLLVVRKREEKIIVVNQFWNDEAIKLYNKLIGDKEKYEQKKKRKYYRKCGVCSKRYEQSEMIRTSRSPNGWLCFDCHNAKHLEYDDLGEELI